MNSEQVIEQAEHHDFCVIHQPGGQVGLDVANCPNCHHEMMVTCKTCYKQTVLSGHRCKTNFEMVKEFHARFRQPVGAGPRIITQHRRELRLALIDEELNGDNELAHSMEKEDLVLIADGLADLLYVVYGTAVEYGIDVDAVFAEVHASNMSKLDVDGTPIYREDGKVMKSSQYQPPEIARVLGLDK